MIAQPASNFVRTSLANRDVVLDVRNLRIHYETPKGDVIAVNGISFQVYKGEIVGLVGESEIGRASCRERV